MLFTFEYAELAAIEAAWSRYREKRGRQSDGRLFRRALRILDGTMLTVNGGTVSFHNPSVIDYLRFHLSAGRADIGALLATAGHADQLYRLVAAARMADGRGIAEALVAAPEQLADAVRDTFDTVSSRPPGIDGEDSNRAGHLEWIVDTAGRLDSAPLAAVAAERLDRSVVDASHEWKLVSLVRELHHSHLIPTDCREEFETMVADFFLTSLAEYLDGELVELAVDCHQNLVYLPYGLLDKRYDQLLERLVDAAVTELHRIAGSNEAPGDIWHSVAVIELLDFLLDHCPGIESEEAYSVVNDRLSKLREARKAQRTDRTVHLPGAWPVSRIHDAGRESEVIAEMMSGLRQPG
ncbi:hypothetical protein EH183_36120 [Streptomyces sp. CB01881]|uniref:hypothetical protein n=1 Tax=Streptomyces sp. CB01881 TaxID=2078691 RepID=UPI000CDC0FEA|nr:hypothetical protein [Streptomyces sp. CB01881]AUY53410.1 hypothetical protein C2142_36060 [Streptomyces sp. CB01881]TYC69563.1 hypothetical protein EH183_36120 [Streptomyces sp. CB01881]